MKKLNLIIIITVLFFNSNYSQEESNEADKNRIVLSAYLPNSFENIPSSARNILQRKLDNIVIKNSLAGINFSNRFILTANIDIANKNITPTAPPMYAYTFDVTFVIGDGISGIKFSSATKTIKGVGKTEDVAFIQAVKDIVHSCTFEKLDVANLPMFDIEYIFLNIRAKSVGEVSKLKLLCPDDGKTYAEVELNLNDVKVHVGEDHTNKIELDNGMGMIMTYPTINSFSDSGIKDINALDAWKRDALVAEKKRLLDSGSDHIEQRVKYLDDILSQDIKAFKYGGFGGKADTIDAEANDFIRLMKKITAVNLLRDTGIASLAEFSGTVSEVGAFNAIKPVMDSFKFSLDRAYMFKTPTERLASLTDDMTSLIGIGFEDMAFTSRGVSKSQQIYKSGMLANVEGGVDALGSVTKSTFGWIENTTRRATANALAVKWGRHFMGQEPDGVIKSFFSLNKKTTNRALENSGLGTWVDDGGQKVFKTNELYDSIKDNYMKHVKFDDKGNPVRMNFDKWMPEAKDAFRDVVKLQTSHIHVNPDSTTTALWMTTGIGQLLNQFRTFSVNAMSKVTGFAFGNLYNGIKHNDPHEVMKFVNNMFWASAMGTLSIGVRDEVKYAGTGRDDVGFNKIMDDPARAMSLGIWRSGFVGSMDMYVATGSQMLGLPDITSGSSFTRKNKKYFDLSSKPVGQLAQNAFEGASAVLQGDGEKAMDKFRKTTPFANMLGIQQMLNVIGVNDKK